VHRARGSGVVSNISHCQMASAPLRVRDLAKSRAHVFIYLIFIYSVTVRVMIKFRVRVRVRVNNSHISRKTIRK